MVGADGRVYGLCGFSVNQTYFSAHHAQPSAVSSLACVLSDAAEGLDVQRGLLTYPTGDFCFVPDELLEKSPFELSGGQKRRVAIAGVMAMHPRVLVLDEPAAGLDPEGRDTILSQIKDYHKKTGITVLLVSHSMEDIAKYANRVLVMHRAKIAMYDTVENVFARAQELLELGLSVPQVTQIFLKLRQMGLDIPADVYTIPYAVKTIQKALAAKQAGEVQ